MSASTETAVSAPTAPTPTLVRGWTEGRARRARMFAALLALVAGLGVWAAFQPWYAWSTSGPATCQPASITPKTTVRTPVTETPVSGVYATGCITGREIALQYSPGADADASVQQAQRVLDEQNYVKPPATMMGLPRTVALFALFALVGMLALFLRNGIVGAVGIIGLYYAHRDLGILQVAMSAGDGGSLNAPQSGLQLFGWALVVGWGLLVSATLFVAKHNADEREIAKRAAIAAGEHPPAGLFDHVLEIAGRKAAVVMDAARREQERSTAATE